MNTGESAHQVDIRTADRQAGKQVGSLGDRGEVVR